MGLFEGHYSAYLRNGSFVKTVPGSIRLKVRVGENSEMRIQKSVCPFIPLSMLKWIFCVCNPHDNEKGQPSSFFSSLCFCQAMESSILSLYISKPYKREAPLLSVSPCSCQVSVSLCVSLSLPVPVFLPPTVP